MFVFGSLKNLLPKFNATIIDNYIFHFHYRLTVIILVAFIILSTAKEYLGDPIKCQTTDPTVKGDVLDQFCWVQSTFSLPEFWHKKVGEEVPYDGIGANNPEKPKVYHKYYQWVPFMLFLQVIMFYLPRYLWKMCEGGKIKTLLMDLDSPLNESQANESKLQQLCQYFQTRLNTHKRYAFSYVLCELLNFANIIGQIYLTDRFLGYSFTTFGTDVIRFLNTDQQDRTDPMVMVFPRMTMCTFYRYGYAAGIEAKESFCILPLNIVNEKIYVFLWFWFVFLATVTSLNIVYRFITLLFPSVRRLRLQCKAELVSAKVVKGILCRYDFGDWFLLLTLAKNMDPMNFKQLLMKMDEVDKYGRPEKDARTMV